MDGRPGQTGHEMAHHMMLGPFKHPCGIGSSGVVVRSVNTLDGSTIALKIIPVNLSIEDCTSVLQQLVGLHNSIHPSVVTFIGADFFQDRSSIIIATEFMDFYSLKDIAAQCGPITEEVAAVVAQAVLSALHYIHTVRKLIHRDIKPSNILLNARGEFKINDFGMSAQLKNTLDPANTWVGSTTYMSPERIAGLQYHFNSDIWSFGITLVELLLGCFPYVQGGGGQVLDMMDLLDRVVDEEPPQLPADRFSIEARNFIAECLIKRVEDRPRAEKLLEHIFVVRSQAPAGCEAVQLWMQHVKQSMNLSPTQAHEARGGRFFQGELNSGN